MCFNDLIGVRDSAREYPDALYFIDDVGITLDDVNGIVDQNYPDGEALFEARKKFAAANVAAEINTHFSRMRARTALMTNQKIGYEGKHRKITPANAEIKKGVYLDFCRSNSFVDVVVSSLEISLFHNLKENPTIPVQIWDVNQNILLDTINVLAVNGQRSRVQVNKTFKGNKQNLQLAFLIPGDYDNVLTNIHPSSCVGCGNVSHNTGYYTANGVTIANAAQVSRANLQNANNTGGLSVEYSVICSIDQWLCGQSHVIALPMLYRVAAELAHQAFLHSGRLNDETTINADQWNQRLSYFETQYAEKMKQALASISIPKNDNCWRCNYRTKNVTML